MTMSVSVLYDADTDEHVLLIPKNATRELAALTEIEPTRYSIIQGNNFERLTVFVRNPVERIISGLHTMTSITHIPVDFYISEIERAGIASIMNAHIAPQFLYLIKSQTSNFQIEPIENVSRFVSSKKTLRPGKFTDKTVDRLMLQYTEDAVLCGLGKQEISMADLVLRIQQELNYVDCMKRYTSYIDYLKKIIK